MQQKSSAAFTFLCALIASNSAGTSQNETKRTIQWSEKLQNTRYKFISLRMLHNKPQRMLCDQLYVHLVT